MTDVEQLQALYDKKNWAKFPRMVTLCKRIIKQFSPTSPGKDNSFQIWDDAMAVILREEKEARGF